MAQYAAAVDQGTTGTRFIIFSRQGRIVASKYEEHSQIYPQAGWVEHDALEIWTIICRVINRVMEDGKFQPDDISGIGITNQRETTVVWDPTNGKPLCNAIVWQDTRTRDLCRQIISEGYETAFLEKTGLPVGTYFSGPKLKWILDNNKGLREKVRNGEAVFGNIDSWIIWNLTGGSNGGQHITDVTNASRTMLMNLHTLDWDDELLDILTIPRMMLPAIRPSSEPSHYGMTKGNGPFGSKVPVCGNLGDQQAALFGQTCFNAGEAKNTYGTGCFMLLNTGAEPIASKSGLLTTVGYGRPDETVYALEGSIAITGAAVQWLRDNLGIIQSASDTEKIAKGVEDAGGVYFVPAFSGLFAPYWDMDARGIIVGLTRYATHAHIVRATLESICYQTRDVLEAMKLDSGVELTSLKVDGGATVNDFLMQLQADVLGVPVIRPVVHETTALGAAYAAGLATGLWPDLKSLRSNWSVDRIFEPQWTEDKREETYSMWKKAVERSRGWVEK